MAADKDPGLIHRLSSQLSLSRLYGWWVGEDERAHGVSVYSLTDRVDLDLSVSEATPGSNISGHMRVEIAEASPEKRVVLALVGKEEVQLRPQRSCTPCGLLRPKV